MDSEALDLLPKRFRNNYHENIGLLACVVALLIVPRHVGPYGTVAFYTIVWLGLAAFYVNRLRQIDPKPPIVGCVLLSCSAALFAYALAIGWLYKTLSGPSALSVTAGGVLLLAFLLTYQRKLFPRVSGDQKRSFQQDFQSARDAQSYVRWKNSR